MSKLSLIATVIPLIIIAIGLIGWVLTLRNDVTGTGSQIDVLQEEVTGIHEQIDSEVERLHTIWDNRFRELTSKIDEQEETIVNLKEQIALADNEMRTIMADHSGFNDVLKELGQAGLLPSGERRTYGGYGN